MKRIDPVRVETMPMRGTDQDGQLLRGPILGNRTSKMVHPVVLPLSPESPTSFSHDHPLAGAERTIHKSIAGGQPVTDEDGGSGSLRPGHHSDLSSDRTVPAISGPAGSAPGPAGQVLPAPVDKGEV